MTETASTQIPTKPGADEPDTRLSLEEAQNEALNISQRYRGVEDIIDSGNSITAQSGDGNREIKKQEELKEIRSGLYDYFSRSLDALKEANENAYQKLMKATVQKDRLEGILGRGGLQQVVVKLSEKEHELKGKRMSEEAFSRVVNEELTQIAENNAGLTDLQSPVVAKMITESYMVRNDITGGAYGTERALKSTTRAINEGKLDPETASIIERTTGLTNEALELMRDNDPLAYRLFVDFNQVQQNLVSALGVDTLREMVDYSEKKWGSSARGLTANIMRAKDVSLLMKQLRNAESLSGKPVKEIDASVWSDFQDFIATKQMLKNRGIVLSF